MDRSTLRTAADRCADVGAETDKPFLVAADGCERAAIWLISGSVYASGVA